MTISTLFQTNCGKDTKEENKQTNWQEKDLDMDCSMKIRLIQTH